MKSDARSREASTPGSRLLLQSSRAVRPVILLLFLIWGFFGGAPVEELPGFAVQSAQAGPLTELNALLEQVRRSVDEQREALSDDTLATLSEATLSAERLIAQAEAAALALEEATASDTLHQLNLVKDTLEELTVRLESGSAELVHVAATKVERAVLQAEASLKSSVDSLRPILAKAERVGGKLIITTGLIISATVVRVVSGIALLIVLVFTSIVIVRQGEWASKWPRLLALLLIASLSAFALLFAPKVANVFATEQEMPDPEVGCREMLSKGPRLVNALGEGRPVDPEFASSVREAAGRCGLFTSSPAEALTAETYLIAALRALGAPIVCRSSTECEGAEVCDVVTGECLERGTYCDLPVDCAPGMQCDQNRRRCVPTAQFDCQNPTRPCRAEDVCHKRRCQAEVEVVGTTCKVPDGRGICREGTFIRQRDGLLCQPNQSPLAREICNGEDDDCNGTIDDSPLLPTSCVAEQALGVCRDGIPQCERGHVVCNPGPAGKREVCNDGIDEDCDGLLNNGCKDKMIDKDRMHCGSGGGGSRVIGGSCGQGYVQGKCWYEGPTGDADLLASANFASSDPHDCTCMINCQSYNYAKGGTWDYYVTAKPEVIRADGTSDQPPPSVDLDTIGCPIAKESEELVPHTRDFNDESLHMHRYAGDVTFHEINKRSYVIICSRGDVSISYKIDANTTVQIYALGNINVREINGEATVVLVGRKDIGVSIINGSPNVHMCASGKINVAYADGSPNITTKANGSVVVQPAEGASVKHFLAWHACKP